MSRYEIKAKHNFIGVWDGDTELAYWHAHKPDSFANAQKFLKQMEAIGTSRDAKGRFTKRSPEALTSAKAIEVQK